MARARVRRISAVTHKRPKGWARISAATFGAVPAATKVLLGSFTLSNPGIGATVLRTRGSYNIISDQTGSVEEQIGAWGMIVVNDLALAAGVASIPGPITDASDDGWFVWEPFQQSGTDASTGVTVDHPFDSKAMRKVREGFSIAVIAENAHATHAFEMAFGIAMLTSIS